MKKRELYKDYTLQGVLDKIDVIECFEYPGKIIRIWEILEKQIDIYKRLGIKPTT